MRASGASFATRPRSNPSSAGSPLLSFRSRISGRRCVCWMTAIILRQWNFSAKSKTRHHPRKVIGLAQPARRKFPGISPRAGNARRSAMQSHFESKGRIEVPSDAPEKLERVTDAIRQHLENRGVIVSPTGGNTILFRGEAVYYQFVGRFFGRGTSNQLLYVDAGEIRVSLAGEQVAIEYNITYKRWPGNVAAGTFVIIFCVGAVWHPQCLFMLPYMALLWWLGPFLRRPYLDRYFHRIATDGLIEGAKKQIETLRSEAAASRV